MNSSGRSRDLPRVSKLRELMLKPENHSLQPQACILDYVFLHRPFATSVVTYVIRFWTRSPVSAPRFCAIWGPGTGCSKGPSLPAIKETGSDSGSGQGSGGHGQVGREAELVQMVTTRVGCLPPSSRPSTSPLDASWVLILT